MLASQIVCHLSPLGAKKFRAGLKRAAKRKAAVPDTPAPVKLQERLAPMGLLEVVDFQQLDSVAPALVAGEALEYEAIKQADGSYGFGPLTWRGNPDEEARAALRRHVAGPAYGPTVTWVVRYYRFASGKEAVHAIMQGQLSDLHRAMPDHMSRDTMRAANVMGLRSTGVRIPSQMEVL